MTECHHSTASSLVRRLKTRSESRRLLRRGRGCCSSSLCCLILFLALVSYRRDNAMFSPIKGAGKDRFESEVVRDELDLAHYHSTDTVSTDSSPWWQRSLQRQWETKVHDTIDSPVASATKMIVARMFFCYLPLPGLCFTFRCGDGRR